MKFLDFRRGYRNIVKQPCCNCYDDRYAGCHAVCENLAKWDRLVNSRWNELKPEQTKNYEYKNYMREKAVRLGWDKKYPTANY